jgi:hypothetical protein
LGGAATSPADVASNAAALGLSNTAHDAALPMVGLADRAWPAIAPDPTVLAGV